MKSSCDASSTRPGERDAARLRRVVDIVLASALLLCCAPSMILSVVAIVIEDGLPIFFSQVRVGQHGVPFRIYKFRKFRKNVGTGGPQLTSHRDPRMTRVGSVLCRTKLDELPQLWNIIRGDMAIVGPRPEAMAFADAFGDFADALKHKPGLVGPSQAVFRDESELFAHGKDVTALYREIVLPAKARIDVAYYPNRTLLKDIWWILSAVAATLRLHKALPEKLQATRDEIELFWLRDAVTPSDRTDG